MSSSSSALPAPITTDERGSSGEEHRQARLLAQQHVEVLEQRAAAGEHDAPVDDVAGQLGRRALERELHRLDDPVDRLGERLADLVDVTVSVRGTPATRSRPLISMVRTSSVG